MAARTVTASARNRAQMTDTDKLLGFGADMRSSACAPPLHWVATDREI